MSHSQFSGTNAAGAVLLVGTYIGLYLWSLYWLYSDAQRRNNTGWLMVLLIGLFSWPIGLIIWFFGRPDLQRTPVEPGTPTDCSRCGYGIPQNVLLCPNCGTPR